MTTSSEYQAAITAELMAQGESEANARYRAATFVPHPALTPKQQVAEAMVLQAQVQAMNDANALFALQFVTLAG